VLTPRVQIAVERRYPLVYRQVLPGGSVFRCRRDEEALAAAHEVRPLVRQRARC
jgi:hypothetical protein